MKRLVLVAVIAILLAGGVLFALRRAATPGSHGTVAALLPSEAIALVQVPDLNRTRDQWHESDIYKLYCEPAVQDFLRKPLTQIPDRDANSQTLRDFERLQIKDGFAALISVENNNPVFLAGFRFQGSRAEANKAINKRREQIAGHLTNPRTEDYQQHKIEITGQGASLAATVFDNDWFFVSNDVDQLKSLLDRADGRSKDQHGTLEQDTHFRAAMAHMPGNYAASFYLQPKSFRDKLASLRSQDTPGSNQRTMLEQISSIGGAVRFDGGKIRDIWFVGMPKQEQNAKLARSAAELGTGDTVLYLATLLNLEKLAGLNQPGSTAPIAAWLQKMFDVASRNGITIDDWKAAFDLELGSLADWPATAHWPSVVASLPVRDPVRANKIVNALTSAIDEDGNWTKIDKDGIHFFTRQRACWRLRQQSRCQTSSWWRELIQSRLKRQ